MHIIDNVRLLLEQIRNIILKHFQKSVNMKLTKTKWRTLVMMIQIHVHLMDLIMNLIINLIMNLTMMNLMINLTMMKVKAVF